MRCFRGLCLYGEDSPVKQGGDLGAAHPAVPEVPVRGDPLALAQLLGRVGARQQLVLVDEGAVGHLDNG